MSAAPVTDRKQPEAALPVRVEGLVRRYGSLVAVNGLSFEVHPGEMFGLIGPDGAGKTTTLRVILGLLATDEGTVTTCGLDPHAQQRRLSHRIGYLSQRFSLYGDLSVDENIAFFASVHGVRAWRPRRDELLDLLRMTPFRDRLADRLSGGMKQKLALAATLIHTPELLVLDEPTTGVDPVSRREFWKILSRLQQGGMTILLTTPYLDEAERCQRVALLDHGRALVIDSPEALRRRSHLAIVEVLATPRPKAESILRGLPGVAAVQVFGERLHATLGPAGGRADGTGDLDANGRLAEAERLRRALAEGSCEVAESRPVEPSLEDIYIAEIRAADADAGTGTPPGAPPGRSREVQP